MKKVVYGISGIENGHLYRQLPVIDYLLSQKCMVMVFTYGSAYDFFTKRYIPALPSLFKQYFQVALVDVPYYIGNKDGLDFSKAVEINSSIDMKNNLQAFAQAQYWIGKPDLIITDYEPYSAQYGYAYQTKVVTIDQQSKYMLKTLPQELNDFNYNDEIMRLKMFFPLAAKRISCSFFKVKNSTNENVDVIPTNIRAKVLAIKNIPTKIPHYIVYLTPKLGIQPSLDEVIFAISRRRKEKFIIFLTKEALHYSQKTINLCKSIHKHIHFVMQGEASFEKLLATCEGIISTAGHTLLSEAMYLGIPVYAMPLPMYEQQLNAEVIGSNGFGMNSPGLYIENLDEFIDKNKFYRQNIINDESVLHKKDGLVYMIDSVKMILNK